MSLDFARPLHVTKCHDMKHLLTFLRRLEAGGEFLATQLARLPQRKMACVLGVVGGLVWLLAMAEIKLELIASGTLTSDIAYYENMLYNTGWSFTNGSFYFLYTMHDVFTHQSYTFLNEHFSPTFALVAPLYRLFPHPEMLSLLQPALILLAAAGIYRLTRILLDQRGVSPAFDLLPAFLAGAYLWNYSNVTTTVDVLYGFHHDSLIPPLLIWTLVAVARQRWRIATVLFVLFLGMKENLPIISVGGLVFCLAFNVVVPRKKAAIALGLCLLFFAGCYWMEFRTHNRHVGIVYRFFDRDQIADLLDSPFQWPILQNYWPALLVPPLALPAGADLILQMMGRTNELDWHSYALMAFAMAGMAWGSAATLGWMKRWKLVSLAGYFALAGWILIPLMAQGVRDSLAIRSCAARLPAIVDIPAAQELAATVPKRAKLGVSSDLLVFVADRHTLYWPEASSLAEYVLVNRRTPAANHASVEAYTHAVGNLERSRPAGYFRDVTNVVLNGYGYDENLLAFLDAQQAIGQAVVLATRGNLVLYQLKQGR
jgi:hypothetical protein